MFIPWDPTHDSKDMWEMLRRELLNFVRRMSHPETRRTNDDINLKNINLKNMNNKIFLPQIKI